MIRKPIVSGQFYEDNYNDLLSQIEVSFKSKFGPGNLPKSKKENKVIGIISPHAGYFFSGHCAAWAYKEIAQNKQPITYLILGLSHQGYPNSISLLDWETPLGIIKNDLELSRLLMDIADIENNEEAHKEEHSIEVQLPFLQFINKDSPDNVRIVPIIVSYDHKELAKNIAKAVKQIKREVCLIASSDFTHFGYNYGYFPFEKNIKENLYKLDAKAIKFIEKLDADGFLDYIDKTGATICGKMPIACIIEITKLIGAKKAELLKYYTSGDIINDYSSAVGYAAIKII